MLVTLSFADAPALLVALGCCILAAALWLWSQRSAAAATNSSRQQQQLSLLAARHLRGAMQASDAAGVEAAIRAVSAMGYAPEQARAALVASGGDPERAAEMLLWGTIQPQPQPPQAQAPAAVRPCCRSSCCQRTHILWPVPLGWHVQLLGFVLGALLGPS
jgi:hypothetical protein